MRAAREEAELVLFESVDAILQKNKLKPSQVSCRDRGTCLACRAVAAKEAGLPHVADRGCLLYPQPQPCKAST